MIVLDANILIRAVLGRRVRELLTSYGDRVLRFYAPHVAFADAEKYLPELLQKMGKAREESAEALEYLRQVVVSIDRDFYGEFEAAARERLRGRDEEDWPVLATALGLGCGIWSEDNDFFGTGIAVWTTSRIEIFLRAQGLEDGED